MARFSYKAVNQGGGHVAGTIEAADRKSAVADLTDKEQFVIELTEEAQSPSVSGNEPRPSASPSEGRASEGLGEKAALELAGFVRFGSRRIS
ncbi:unnamed protein product, partial [marine sediment metagenome]